MLGEMVVEPDCMSVDEICDGYLWFVMGDVALTMAR